MTELLSHFHWTFNSKTTKQKNLPMKAQILSKLEYKSASTESATQMWRIEWFPFANLILNKIHTSLYNHHQHSNMHFKHVNGRLSITRSCCLQRHWPGRSVSGLWGCDNWWHVCNRPCIVDLARSPLDKASGSPTPTISPSLNIWISHNKRFAFTQKGLIFNMMPWVIGRCYLDGVKDGLCSKERIEGWEPLKTSFQNVNRVAAWLC